LRSSLLRDVFGANLLVQKAVELRAAYPHADPALFSPERLSSYRSPDSFEFEVAESHRRVDSILVTQTKAIEERIREELAKQFPGAAGGLGPAGATPPPGGDPTVEQLQAMSMEEWDDLEARNPGVIERVLSAAGVSS
jgi:hypothetical protein